MKTDNRFNFFVPIDSNSIEKAAQLPIEDRYKNMILEGVASDNSQDIEGEILEPAGYIVDHFLSNGYANYEHLAKRSPKFIIGNPIEAKVDGDKFRIKVKLWEKSELARDVWDKILEMNENGSGRSAGWSIEGKSLQKDPMNPKRITKALITNVALTFSPVNKNTFASIAKGLQKEDFVESQYEVADVVDYIFEFEKDGKLFRVSKEDFKIYEVQKSMTTESSAPLMPESLDKKVKLLEPDIIKKSIDTIMRFKGLQCLDDDDMKLIRNKIKNFC